jgi:hypothetical protein
VRTSSPISSPAKKLRLLRKCLIELQALYAEAIDILNDLLIGPSADIVCGLCARFQILQEYFAMRYREARAHAISALGDVKAAFYFP